MQKERIPRNTKYLQYIRSHECVACGHPPGPAEIQAAHVRFKSNAGLGQKPSDYRTLPLCPQCHMYQHHVGEPQFWGEQGKDPFILIAAMISGYFEDRQRPIHLLETYLEHGKKEKIKIAKT